MRLLHTVLIWCYRVMLKSYPSAYRKAFADEMEATFRQFLDEASGKGSWRVLWLLMCEIRDLPLELWGAYRHQVILKTTAGLSIAPQDPWRRIAQRYTLGLSLLFAIAWLSLVAYQNLLLVCRPNCVGADLRGSVLYRPYSTNDPEIGLSMRLRDVDFRGARFDGADLRGGMMRKVNVVGATFTRSTLRHTDFAWADMRGADFGDADLFRANLYDVDLRSASFFGADLRSAYMVDADLRGADLSNVNLEGAVYSDGTLWPDGFDPVAAGAIYQKVCTRYLYCD